MKRVLRESFQIQRAPLELGFAARCTIGVALPLLFSLLSGHPGWGVGSAVGALCVGFASRQGVYRTRVAAMLLTAAGMAISTFAGAMAGVHPIAIAFVTAIWAFAYGLVASLGQAATIVGQNSVLALVIFSAYAFTPAEAAVQALLLFGGGLFQMLLLVGVWPLQRFSSERSALAQIYRNLAAYARQLPTAT
ncbi:MAG TPA: FUSC family membrane protein, partial [Candidatus Baltobacteraceae bacterium]|nr:FUSC family membrane protein [Candidatus Baltobacteraceae bacterium]